MNAVAIDLAALGDVEPLWRDWLDDTARRMRVDVSALDEQLPNWRRLLERLDRLCDEMHSLNRHLDTSEQLLRIARELSTLNESLQALAYAALGQQAPTVRRRRTG